MKKYHKIENIFKRETTGTKKLLDGVYNDPTIEYLQNCLWIATEKVDGTNIRVYWDGHTITFGGRTEKSEIPSHLLAKLNEMFQNPETEQLFEQMFGEKEVILFGEGYGNRIQAVGSLYRDDVGFILFDIWIGSIDDGFYLERKNVVQIAEALNLEVVPIVKTGTLPELVEYVKRKPVSLLSGRVPMEGVVARPALELCSRDGKRLITKIKACDFEEVK